MLLAVLFVVQAKPAESSAGRYSIQFKEHLKISNDLKLTGGHASSTLRFTCESTWKPIAGSTLHLFIDHSPVLDGSRSFLSVMLNYGVLRSLRLDDHNQPATEVIIPFPPEMLQLENEIVFSVEQFAGGRNSSDIWTAIKPSSFISIEYEEKRPALDLRLLPSPLVDPHSYRPKQLSVLLPGRLSSQTLEATALLIANYSADIGEALMVRTIRSIDAASGHLLMVGTPDEQPFGLLEDRLPFGLFRVGNKIRHGMKNHGPFEAEEGVVALIQGSEKTFKPILVVTGNSPAAVSRAAGKLIEGHFESPGTFARISQNVRMDRLPPREWKGFLPPSNHFTLGQMGLKELKIDSQNDFSLSLPLLATPDAQFLEYGHQMTLEFRLNPDVSIENTKLDVDLNGAMLGRFEIVEFSAGSKTSIHFKIPTHLLRRQNVLNITWRGLDGAPGNDPAAWLLPSSAVDLPRDYRSDLPDLGLVQYGLFPFGLRSDLSDTILVIPDDSGDEAAAAVFELAGLLGRLVPSDRFAFGVKHMAELSQESRLSSHMIAFRIGELPKGMSSKGAVAAIQESVSPWNSHRYMLSITSTSPPVLHTAIKTVFSQATLRQFHGDTAYIYSDRVSSFKTVPVQQIYEYSYFTHLQAWLRENWIGFPVILTTVSCLLFLGLRLALAQYKARRSAA
ncbi:MAG TPA: cellulose biosynthesis cyclic di-GMP-binding regulatory protein BcsB [Terriglobia bacterium]|nr:cellulose biosynthesis cyclic di-GMP-binding regulatory protein BcsB [Terriglobia bacterium]